jgi:hypothetical protein
MISVLGVGDEDLGGVSQAIHSVGERFVVDVMEFDVVESLLGQLANRVEDQADEGWSETTSRCARRESESPREAKPVGHNSWHHA